MTRILAIALVLAGAAWAQTAPAPQPASAPAELTEAQLRELVAQARPATLARERASAAREIEDGLLYELDAVDAAVADLRQARTAAPAENVERIVAAFAAVDPRLAGAVEKLAAENFAAALAQLEPTLNPTGTGYADAVRRLLQADALAGLDRTDDALAAYQALLAAMPDKVSFASQAALRAADALAAAGRQLNAARLYAWWAENYGFLEPDRAEALALRARQILADYDRPLTTLAQRMTTVQQRLAEGDSGPETQDRQRQILAMLDDLIASGQQGSGGSGSPQPPPQGQGQDQGQPGPLTGNPAGGPPASPAANSVLPGGNSPRPQGLSAVRPSDETDAWGDLPIRQRERLVELLQQKYPQRYSRMLEEYYRITAENP